MYLWFWAILLLGTVTTGCKSHQNSDKKLEDQDVLNRIDVLEMDRKLHEVWNQNAYNYTTTEQRKGGQIFVDSEEVLRNVVEVILENDPSLTRNQLKKKCLGKSYKLITNGTSVQKQRGMVKIVIDSMVNKTQQLTTLLKLTATDLGIDQQSFDEIMSMEIFQELEEDIATAIQEFAPAATTTEDTHVDTTEIEGINYEDGSGCPPEGCEELNLVEEMTTDSIPTETNDIIIQKLKEEIQKMKDENKAQNMKTGIVQNFYGTCTDNYLEKRIQDVQNLFEEKFQMLEERLGSIEQKLRSTTTSSTPTTTPKPTTTTSSTYFPKTLAQ